VVATERRPNTPHEFHFWTALASPVGIGTIVRVDGRPVDGVIPHIFGIVIEGLSYTDLMSPLHDVIGHDGTPGSAGYAPTDRAEIRLYTAAVLRQIPDEPLQPVPMGHVFLATEEDVAIALRMDGYLREGNRTGIPSAFTALAAPTRRSISTRISSSVPSGTPQHHRRLGARDQDLRCRVDVVVDLRTLPREQRVCRSRLLQRQRPGPVLPGSTGRARRSRPRAL
jgi:hypothetical protein